MSGDGSAVVGWSERQFSGKNQLFLWTQDDGMVELGPLPGFDNVGAGYISISEDASSVIGGFFGNSGLSAFRWTEEEGMVGMSPPGMNYSLATAVSADGSIIVGTASADANSWDGFIWDDENGFQSLGSKPPNWETANPWLLSADGGVVFGKDSCPGCSFGRAFRWTVQEGLQAIPGTSESSTWYVLQDLTPDGSIVVGSTWDGDDGATSRASIWDEQHGTRDLRDVLISEHGFSDADLPTLYDVTGISADAKTIVGSSSLSEDRGGWAIYLDKPLVTTVAVPEMTGDFNDDGTVDAADYLVWRNGVGTDYTQADYAVWRANFGATAAGVAAAANILQVPEPASIALFWWGVFVVSAGRQIRASRQHRVRLTTTATLSRQSRGPCPR